MRKFHIAITTIFFLGFSASTVFAETLEEKIIKECRADPTITYILTLQKAFYNEIMKDGDECVGGNLKGKIGKWNFGDADLKFCLTRKYNYNQSYIDAFAAAVSSANENTKVERKLRDKCIERVHASTMANTEILEQDKSCVDHFKKGVYNTTVVFEGGTYQGKIGTTSYKRFEISEADVADSGCLNITASWPTAEFKGKVCKNDFRLIASGSDVISGEWAGKCYGSLSSGNFEYQSKSKDIWKFTTSTNMK